MAFSKLLRWFDGARRDSVAREPRSAPAGLPGVEQFERRLCLGTIAAATAEQWTHEPCASPRAEEVAYMPSSSGSTDLTVAAPHSLHSAAENIAAQDFEAAPACPSPSPAPVAGGALPASGTPIVASSLNSALAATESPSSTDAGANPDSEITVRPPAAAGGAGAVEAPLAEAPAGDATVVEFDFSNNGSTGGDVALMLSQMSDAAESELMTAAASSDFVLLAAPQLTAADVETILCRAAAATSTNDAIIAVVDRNGRILGVRVESDVLAAIPDNDTLVFAIDGAVAKARTAAMFASDEGPLTSRTVRFISQSTITEREVESNPNADGASQATALASTVRGPGFVAPIGVGGHFPPEIVNTPLVDLFGIEHTNRDSTLHPGADGVRGTGDDFLLRTSAGGVGRFNVDPTFVPAGQELFAPESYGSLQNSGLLPDAQSRGIATLPGGLPIYGDGNADGAGDTLIGGIGVFFPGADGFATHEQNFIPGIGQTEFDRTNAPKVLESEYIAFAAIGGSSGLAMMADARADSFAALDAACGAVPFDFPAGRIDLVGITLESIGPQAGNCGGLTTVLDVGAALGTGDANSGVDMPVTTGGALYRAGLEVPDGFLVTPHDATDGSGLTAAQVNDIILQGIAAADETRAAIRAPLGQRTKMVFAVTDTNGEVLGLYRMPDATTFSLDVAVAKARNVAYYADAGDLQAIDQVPGVAAGTAFTNRTFRFLAQPRFPSGIDGTAPPEFSILNDDAINDLTAENEGGPAPVAAFTSVYGHDAYFPMTNFRDPGDAGVVAAGGAAQPLANQNGIVFFPGSTPLYVDGQLVGGFGVSGDGVDQDDVVTFLGAFGYLPDTSIVRADQAFYRDVRLPYQKFLRNPFG